MNSNLAGETSKIIKKFNLRPKKKYGQNFLINERILTGILAGAELKPEDTVVEIGPGLGNLTIKLAQQVKNLLAIEIDSQLITVLEEVLAPYPNAKLLEGDILQLNLDQEVAAAFSPQAMPYKIVANLPYYITTPIIMGLLENPRQITTMVLMVQKEVGERMEATPGTKAYGSLSLAVQYYAETKIISQVPPSSFRPMPGVDSVVIKLELREKPAVNPQDEKLFFQVIKGAFAQRRKTLANSLSNYLGFISKEELNNVLENLGIDKQIRGEELSLEELCKLSDQIGNLKTS